MKSLRKLFGIVSAVLLIAGSGMWVSCSDDDDGGTSYSISVAAADKTVTLAPGASKTVSVRTNGTMLAPVSSDSDVVTAEISNSAKTLTITASDSVTQVSPAEVTVKISEDSSKSIKITVTVDPDADVETFDLNLTLAQEIADQAASITVYAEGKEDGVDCPENKKQTVTADYAAGETTAIAKLNIAKANSYNYFNNIAVTVKDSQGNVIETESTPVYFLYTDTSFTGITVSAKKSSKTFTINFEGFTVEGGSVAGLKYSTVWASSSSDWADETTVTPAVTVSDDGTKATFTVDDTNEFYIDWTAVVVKDSSGNAVEINSGNTEGNKWYSYSGDVWSHTLEVVSATSGTLITSTEVTIAAEGTYQLLVSYDDIKDYDTVHITLAEITAWGTGTYDLPCLGTSEGWKANTAWVESGAFVDANVESSTGGYYASISPADYPDGVYITGKAGLAGTIFVSGE